MFRYHPQIRKIIELIQRKEIGKVISMETVFWKKLITKKKFFWIFQIKEI